MTTKKDSLKNFVPRTEKEIRRQISVLRIPNGDAVKLEEIGIVEARFDFPDDEEFPKSHIQRDFQSMREAKKWLTQCRNKVRQFYASKLRSLNSIDFVGFRWWHGRAIGIVEISAVDNWRGYDLQTGEHVEMWAGYEHPVWSWRTESEAGAVNPATK
jgi:hypothetical protein